MDNNDRLSKLEKTVYGNGDEGMDENVRTMSKDLKKLDEKLDKHMEAHENIESHMQPTESDVRLILNIIRKEWNLDALGNPRTQYDKTNHPGRRSDDEKTDWKKLFVEKVLSPLVVGITLWLLLEFMPGVIVLLGS